MASNTGESCSSASQPSGNSNGESYSLKHLHPNKLSHKISKPLIRKPAVASSLDPLPPPNLTQPIAVAAVDDQNAPPQQSPQPPVYNINKSDFRDVVQRLTGAPPLDHSAQQPPSVQPARPPNSSSSRLHRIRPPPLAQLTAWSPPMIHRAIDPTVPAAESSDNPILRPGAPLSPLPPLPGVHLAAESPVSAYMRRLQSSSAESGPNQLSCLSPLAPPRWPVEQGAITHGPATATATQSQSQQAPSPLSPQPYRLIPPVSLFPSTSPNQLMGFLFPQLPPSPTVPSPKP